MIKEKISAFFLVQDLRTLTPFALGSVKNFSNEPLYESSMSVEEREKNPVGPVAKIVFFNLIIGKGYKLGVSVKDSKGNKLAPESYGPFDFAKPIAETRQTMKKVNGTEYAMSSMFFTLPDFVITSPDEVEFTVWLADSEDFVLDKVKTYLRIDQAYE